MLLFCFMHRMLSDMGIFSIKGFVATTTTTCLANVHICQWHIFDQVKKKVSEKCCYVISYSINKPDTLIILGKVHWILGKKFFKQLTGQLGESN